MVKVTRPRRVPPVRPKRTPPTRPVRKKQAVPRGLPLSGAEPEYSWDPWGTTGRTHDNCYDYAFGSFSANRRAKSAPGDHNNKHPHNNVDYKRCDGIAKLVVGDNPNTVYRMKNPNERCRPGYYKVMCFVAPSNDYGEPYGDFHWYRQNSSIRYRIRGGDTLRGLAKFFKVKPEVITAALLKKTAPLSNTNGLISNSRGNFAVLNRNNESRPNTNILSSLPTGVIIRIPVNLWSHKQGWATGPLLVDAKGHTISDPRKADRSYKPGFHYTTFCSAYGVKKGEVTTGNNNGNKPMF
jgi:hypothetical protein